LLILLNDEYILIAEKQQVLKLIFGLIRLRLEPMIYGTQGFIRTTFVYEPNKFS